MEDVNGKRVGGAFNPTESFCFLSGLHTKPLYMSYTNFHVLGVQMDPLAVKALFGLPGCEVRDWAVLGEHIVSGMAEIEDHLRTQGDFEAKAKWLEDYLANKIRETSELYTAFKIKDTIHRARRRLRAGERVQVESLTGYSRMHTSRLFKEWFGLAPGQTMRLHQFTDALNLLHQPGPRLTDIGLESGFYDQAHFIRIFREFSDMTPSTYKNRRSPLVGQLTF